MTNELEKGYTNYKEAEQQVIDYMIQQGKNCVVKFKGVLSVLEVEGQKYTMDFT